MKYVLNKRWWLIAFSILICLALTIPAHASEEVRDENVDLFQEILEYIRGHHLSNPSSESLINGAIQGMIDALNDPYTSYLTEKEFEEFLQALDSSFIGVGVYIEVTEKGVMVEGVIPGSPAEKAGLKKGDIITHINDQPLAGVKIEQVKQLLTGQPGSKVKVKAVRIEQGTESTATYTLVLEKLFLPQVKKELYNQNVGYLKIYAFGDETANLVDKELEALKKQGMEKLIIDLRGNPGGFLNSVVDIASLFRTTGTVVNVKDSKGKVTPITIKSGRDFDLPIAVLIDEGSASASEILAGFLKDTMNATIVGETSYGKGTVQRLLPIERGGVLKLTVEEYYTPKMKKVNNIGIQPDFSYEEPSLQLAKAYGLLTKKAELHLSAEGEILINGMKDAEYSLKAIQQEDQWYFPLRLLSDWFEGKITWKEKSKYIEVIMLGTKYALPKDKILLHEGRSYLPTESIDALLPLQSKKHNDMIIIQYK
ncbi:S41 family peptidase [Caldalkalibacillus mannanilyticus]|uniref:S41 family peptidase n=1 Tax=Caldalkalibacillus mannanilyticus TaxID=1418 RepID=UPI0004698E09|nr:S41 family peptidase [Caldalkalibacillus mannanilyticus]